jgi:hypothetical protein
VIGPVRDGGDARQGRATGMQDLDRSSVRLANLPAAILDSDWNSAAKPIFVERPDNSADDAATPESPEVCRCSPIVRGSPPLLKLELTLQQRNNRRELCRTDGDIKT